MFEEVKAVSDDQLGAVFVGLLREDAAVLDDAALDSLVGPLPIFSGLHLNYEC